MQGTARPGHAIWGCGKQRERMPKHAREGWGWRRLLERMLGGPSGQAPDVQEEDL
jgi:hypothetical protein